MKRLMIVTLLISIVCFCTIAIADESETIYAGSDSDAQIVTNGHEVYLNYTLKGILSSRSTLCCVVGETCHYIRQRGNGSNIAIIGDMILVESYTANSIFDHLIKEVHITGYELHPPFAKCYHTYREWDSSTLYHFVYDRLIMCTHDAERNNYVISVAVGASSCEETILDTCNSPSIHSTYAAFKSDSDIDEIKILDFQTMETYTMPEESFRTYGGFYLPQGVLVNGKLFYLQSDGIYLLDFDENDCRVVVPVDQPQYFFVADNVLYTRYDDETILAYSMATGTSTYFKCPVERRERYVVANNKIYIAEYRPHSQAKIASYRSVDLVETDEQ